MTTAKNYTHLVIVRINGMPDETSAFLTTSRETLNNYVRQEEAEDTIDKTVEVIKLDHLFVQNCWLQSTDMIVEE